MGGPIARRPSGLLDLLLTQQQGQNPISLGDLLSPTIDLFELYAVDRLTVEKNTANFTAVGNTVAVTIPAGEMWYVRSLGTRWTWATASQDIKGHYQVINVPSNTLDLPGSDLIASTGISDTASHGLMFPAPVGFPSGTSIRWICDSINLDGEANILMNHQVLYTRMEI